MNRDEVIEVLGKMKQYEYSYMEIHATGTRENIETLTEAISMIKELKELKDVNRKLTDLHFEKGHEIAELKAKYKELEDKASTLNEENTMLWKDKEDLKKAIASEEKNNEI